MKREHYDFIDEYFSSKARIVFDTEYYEWYAFSSNRGKFGISNSLLFELMEGSVYSKHDVLFFFKMVSMVEVSSDYYKSGVVRLLRKEFLKWVPKNEFSKCKQRFVRDNILVKIPGNSTYFILNPLYVNKFRKGKRDKKV